MRDKNHYPPDIYSGDFAPDVSLSTNRKLLLSPRLWMEKSTPGFPNRMCQGRFPSHPHRKNWLNTCDSFWKLKRNCGAMPNHTNVCHFVNILVQTGRNQSQACIMCGTMTQMALLCVYLCYLWKNKAITARFVRKWFFSLDVQKTLHCTNWETKMRQTPVFNVAANSAKFEWEIWVQLSLRFCIELF